TSRRVRQGMPFATLARCYFITAALADTALKMASACSFTPPKLRVFGHFRLVSASLASYETASNVFSCMHSRIFSKVLVGRLLVGCLNVCQRFLTRNWMGFQPLKQF